MSRASLIEAYISGLNLTRVAIVASPDGRRCRIILSTGELAPCERIKFQFYFKLSHVELLLATLGLDGWTDQQPAALAASIERAAAMLGAPFQTPAALRKAAGQAVDEITARVKIANQDGELKRVNYAYKVYRLEQIAKGEKAIGYQAHLEVFTASLVRQAAARMV